MATWNQKVNLLNRIVCIAIAISLTQSCFKEQDINRHEILIKAGSYYYQNEKLNGHYNVYSDGTRNQLFNKYFFRNGFICGYWEQIDRGHRVLDGRIEEIHNIDKKKLGIPIYRISRHTEGNDNEEESTICVVCDSAIMQADSVIAHNVLIELRKQLKKQNILFKAIVFHSGDMEYPFYPVPLPLSW